MALKTFNPTSPSRRALVQVDRTGLHKGRPEKSLTEGLTKKGGRNNTGRITMRRQGGGHKRLYRKVDFKRNKLGVEATVLRLEYDPNRTAFIALIQYKDGEKSYILAPQRLSEGDKVISAEKADVKPGNCMPLRAMPVGTIIHNIELKPGKGGQIAVLLALMLSLLAVMAVMLKFVSSLAKCAWFTKHVLRRLVRCQILTT